MTTSFYVGIVVLIVFPLIMVSSGENNEILKQFTGMDVFFLLANGTITAFQFFFSAKAV